MSVVEAIRVVIGSFRAETGSALQALTLRDDTFDALVLELNPADPAPHQLAWLVVDGVVVYRAQG